MTAVSDHARVLISCPPADRSMAEQLGRELQRLHVDSAVDVQDAAGGWQERVIPLLTTADALVMLLGRDSFSLTAAAEWELDEAARRGTPVFGVVWRPIRAADVPARLSLSCCTVVTKQKPIDDFLPGTLAKKIQAAARWTRALQGTIAEAAAWDAAGRPRDGLLAGYALADVEDAITHQPDHAPAVPPVVAAFVDASRREQETSRAARVSLPLLAQRAFVLPAKAALAERRFDEALRLVAAGAFLLDDVGLTLDAATPLAHRFALWRSAIAAIQHSSHAVLHGRQGKVERSAFSADGRRVVTAASDGTAAVWDVDSGSRVAVLRGHDDSIDVALDVDGTRAITTPISWSSLDDAPRLWTVDTATEIAALRGRRMNETSAFTADGTLAFTFGANSVAFWDGRTGAAVGALRGSNPEIDKAHFSADGQTVVTHHADGTAILWNARTGSRISASFPDEDASRFVFSVDNAYAAAARPDHTGGVWDLRSGRRIALLQGHDAAITVVAFAPDGTRLATASRDGTVRVWTSATGEPLAVMRGPAGPVTILAFSTDGAKVASGSDDGMGHVWDVKTAQEIAPLRGHTDGITCAAFSPDGRRIATGSTDQTTRLWDAWTGAAIAICKADEPYEHPVSAVAFTRDGDRLITTYVTTAQWLWDGQTGAYLTGLYPYGAFSPDGRHVVTYGMNPDYWTARLWDASDSSTERFLLNAHEWKVTGARFSADSRRLITGSFDKTARVWDVATGQELAVLPGHVRDLVGLELTADGRTALTWSFERKTAHLWNVDTATAIATLRADESPLTAFAANADGTITITGDEQGVARVRNTRTRSEVALHGHGQAITCAAISPDGARAATGSMDGPARLWDPVTGGEVALLAGHSNSVHTLEFIRGGAYLVTRAQDEPPRLWDAQTGAALTVLPDHQTLSPDGTLAVAAVEQDQEESSARLVSLAVTPEIATIRGHGKRIVDVALSADGLRAITTSRDGTTRAWNAETGEEINVLRTHDADSHVTLSPDGTHAITSVRRLRGSQERTTWYDFVLWDVTNGTDVAALGASETGYVTFSADGSHALISGRSGTANVWNVRSGTAADLKSPERIPGASAISSDGLRAAFTAADGGFQFRDIAAGSVSRSLFGPEDRGYDHIRVETIAFSTDGTRAAVILLAPPPIPGKTDARNEPVARVVDVAAAEEIAVLRGHAYSAACVVFSPAGALVLTGSADGTARLWDAATGAEMGVLRGHEKTVTSVAFSADGLRAITGSEDGTARVWDVRRWAAFDGDRAVFLAAALDCGVGIRTVPDRSHLLLQDAPDDLFAAVMKRLTPEQRARVPEVSRRVRAPLHPNCYPFVARPRSE